MVHSYSHITINIAYLLCPDCGYPGTYRIRIVIRKLNPCYVRYLVIDVGTFVYRYF